MRCGTGELDWNLSVECERDRLPSDMELERSLEGVRLRSCFERGLLTILLSGEADTLLAALIDLLGGLARAWWRVFGLDLSTGSGLLLWERDEWESYELCSGDL